MDDSGLAFFLERSGAARPKLFCFYVTFWGDAKERDKQTRKKRERAPDKRGRWEGENKGNANTVSYGSMQDLFFIAQVVRREDRRMTGALNSYLHLRNSKTAKTHCSYCRSFFLPREGSNRESASKTQHHHPHPLHSSAPQGQGRHGDEKQHGS